MAKKSTKKSRKNWKRRVRYGMVKIPKGAKICWLSYENKHGWSLGLATEKRTLWLKNTRFASEKDVARAIEGSKIVFVRMKSSK